MAKEDGILFKTKQKNWDAIAEHPKHTSHIAIIQRLQKNTEMDLPKEIEEAQKKSVENLNVLYDITSKMFRTVYAEILT